MRIELDFVGDDCFRVVCSDIKSHEFGNYRFFEGSNGWSIGSDDCPDVCESTKRLWVWGSWRSCDNNVVYCAVDCLRDVVDLVNEYNRSRGYESNIEVPLRVRTLEEAFFEEEV